MRLRHHDKMLAVLLLAGYGVLTVGGYLPGTFDPGY